MSIKVVLADKPNKDHTYAIRFRFIVGRVVRYANTGIHIQKEAWNPAPEIGKDNYVHKRLDKLAGIYNQEIKADFLWLKSIAHSNRHWSADRLKEAYERYLQDRQAGPEPENDCFLVFADTYIKESSVSANTKILYTSIVNKVRTFQNPVPFDYLTIGFARKYLKHLKSIGNSAETIKTNFTVLKDVAERAVKQKYLDENPFEEVDYQVKGTRKKKIRPTAEQLDLEHVYFSKPLSAYQQHAWNVFRMQYYLHGARVGDVLELSHANITADRIEYTTRKNGKFKSIKRTREINLILRQYPASRHYVFPYLKDELQRLKENIPQEEWLTVLAKKKISAESNINKRLKEIAKKAGLNIPLSTHMARHMMADAIIQSTNDIRVVQNFLGHGSSETSEKYVQDLNQTALDEIAERVYQKK